MLIYHNKYLGRVCLPEELSFFEGRPIGSNILRSVAPDNLVTTGVS